MATFLSLALDLALYMRTLYKRWMMLYRYTLYLALYTGMFSVARWDSRCRYTYTVVPCPCTLAIWRSPLKYLNRYLIIKNSKIFMIMSKIFR